MSQQPHPTFGNGKICYIELPALDINRSADFYKAVFGWNVRQNSEGNTSFDDGVGEVSGTWRTDLQPAKAGSLTVHIMVDDLNATIAAVTANGGAITEPPSKDGSGSYARFSDPAGNILGLHQQGG
ncbi:VOC family protein [Chitinophaga agrisoli]|uniref:VOC family protein n=1 Tax=Chitinophaga agrisoli TaxID=2607653 RepID=A0A5B2W252_9BACT|nr:VOC family protein [Chitinophaga agrisoli]KAA2245445.1 VOC family protein [Chitinophaga agrisoli]